MCGVWNHEISVPLSGRSSVQKPQTGRGHKAVYYCWLKLSLGLLAVLRVTAAVPDRVSMARHTNQQNVQATSASSQMTGFPACHC